MGDLRLLSLKDNYRSDRDDIVTGFYVPVLSESSSYDRAVGYFTATSLALFSRGLERLVRNGGRIRLIASPYLLPEDAEDIARGYAVREVMARAAIRELEITDDGPVDRGLGHLGRLIAEGVLDIKIAFLRRSSSVALYHEKMGIFRDECGSAISFAGSANETLGGLVGNFECIEVYTSWDERDQKRVLRMASDFNELWANRTPNLVVEEFPEVTEKILSLRSRTLGPLPEQDDPLVVDGPAAVRAGLGLPSGFHVRPYQRSAVEAWFTNGGRGVFKMATGTGKTKTALVAAWQLAQVLKKREMGLAIVIVAPYQHLVDQWVEELSLFGENALPLYESSSDWIPKAAAMIDAANLGRTDAAVFVTTTKTFTLAPCQELLKRIKCQTLLIGDEVHNLGSRSVLTALPPFINFRLGLSATPERWLDEAGTDALFNYFGKVVFEFGMQQAMKAGALCHYRYHPRIVELDEDEYRIYGALTDAIAAMMASGADAEDDDGPLGQLLRKRSQVLGHATRKLQVFREDINAHRDDWYQLVYCAEGRKPTEEGYEDGPRQISKVLSLLGNDMHLSAHSYVSETRRDDRRRLLRRFSSGDDLRVLVSMKCLDEGVDIPDARVAYLISSSSNPRQFVQRRGRILRQPADGSEKVADIYDYLAVPPAATTDHFQVERRLVERELTRASEFAQLADNYGFALDVLRDIKKRYGLIDI